MKYILNDPSDFCTPNEYHNIYTPTMNKNSETQVIDKTNDMQIDHNTKLLLEFCNTFDNEIRDNKLDNTEEEVIFNYDKVDEDELEDQVEEVSNNELNQQNIDSTNIETFESNNKTSNDNRQEYEYKSICTQQSNK